MIQLKIMFALKDLDDELRVDHPDHPDHPDDLSEVRKFSLKKTSSNKAGPGFTGSSSFWWRSM